MAISIIPLYIHALNPEVIPVYMYDNPNIVVEEKYIGKNICFHLHFLTTREKRVRSNRRETNTARITKPPSHILKNLQGSNLNK